MPYDRPDTHKKTPARAPRAHHARPAEHEDQPEAPENLLVGRRSIREAIRSGRDIEKLLVVKGDLSSSAREIIAKARERQIVVQEVERSRLDAVYENHQGMLAFVSAARYSDMEDIFALAEARGELPFIVALDGITDPHNLGAVIRTAECSGAHGVLIPKRRAVGLTPAAVKAAAGAEAYVPVVRVTNMVRALEDTKARGAWVIGAAMDGEDVFEADLTGPIVLVIGAEGEGLASLTEKTCDKKVAIPLAGQIESLNASVAAGILMYAVVRARGA